MSEFCIFSCYSVFHWLLEVDLDEDLRYLPWAGEGDASVNANTDSEN